MLRRFFASLLVATAFAGVFQLSAAARGPQYLACELQDGSELLIVIENFGGMGGAVQHCVHFWHGRPRGVVK
jgi:hypothetical protein